MLASDASSAWGMAGVLLFPETCSQREFDGLFWQIQWEVWAKRYPMVDLKPGNIKINVAEFLAALITCETFADHCRGKITTIKIDNISAKSWLDSARCPRYPFDRCAQGVHLYMVQNAIKVKSTWIPSGDNTFADICSRKLFQEKPAVSKIAGKTLMNVKARWKHVTRFIVNKTLI